MKLMTNENAPKHQGEINKILSVVGSAGLVKMKRNIEKNVHTVALI